jgi:hypothetical protein
MHKPTVFLSIKNGGKGIPYGGADEDRPDGSRNHGFKRLKSNQGEIATVPEASGITALENALVALNAPASPFFTVGCEKAFGKNDSGHWISGYLEFAFNYGELVVDAGFYPTFRASLTRFPGIFPRASLSWRSTPRRWRDIAGVRC